MAGRAEDNAVAQGIVAAKGRWGSMVIFRPALAKGLATQLALLLGPRPSGFLRLSGKLLAVGPHACTVAFFGVSMAVKMEMSVLGSTTGRNSSASHPFFGH